LLSTEITRHVHGLANQQKPIKGQPDIWGPAHVSYPMIKMGSTGVPCSMRCP
jgi:hypothetical protein